mmetsp:Transcript_22870/g.58825  ORF Transcript_22870/g.58825 Transcript_22870/m.58825 type:complete len:299 (+) Transcript_22870:238-1134(+)
MLIDSGVLPVVVRSAHRLFTRATACLVHVLFAKQEAEYIDRFTVHECVRDCLDTKRGLERLGAARIDRVEYVDLIEERIHALASKVGVRLGDPSARAERRLEQRRGHKAAATHDDRATHVGAGGECVDREGEIDVAGLSAPCVVPYACLLRPLCAAGYVGEAHVRAATDLAFPAGCRAAIHAEDEVGRIDLRATRYLAEYATAPHHCAASEQRAVGLEAQQLRYARELPAPCAVRVAGEELRHGHARGLVPHRLLQRVAAHGLPVEGTLGWLMTAQWHLLSDRHPTGSTGMRREDHGR